MATFGITLGTVGFPLAQQRGLDFNSLCRFQGKTLGANANGIFELDSGDTDSGVDIEAFVGFPKSDFNVENQKRLRAVYLGMESDGKLILRIKLDEGTQGDFILEPVLDSERQEGNKVYIDRMWHGRYVEMEVRNLDGSDFSLDFISLLLAVLHKNVGRNRPGRVYGEQDSDMPVPEVTAADE